MTFTSIFVRPEVENSSRVIFQGFKSRFDHRILEMSTFSEGKSSKKRYPVQGKSGRSYEKANGQKLETGDL